MALLVAEHIGKQLGGRNVLVDVNLQVGAGEVVALLGPNGAGKSTLLKILALLMNPSRGRLFIGGEPATLSSDAARGKLGAVLHSSLLYDGLTAVENLEFYGKLYGLKDLTVRIQEVLDEVGMRMYGRDLVRTYSQGMRQRVALARATLHRPQLLLLDEPFSGLDVFSAERFAAMLQRYKAGGGAVVLVTHQWDHLTEVADRAVVLTGGRISAEMPALGAQPDDLRSRYREAVGMT